MNNRRTRSGLYRQFQLITIAGSLAMVYMGCVTSPVATNFFRSLGATDVHFGLLAGLPMIMLIFQFVGAYISATLPRRKPWFMALIIASRLLYLPLAFIPLLFPGIPTAWLLPILIGLLALSKGLENLISPLWLSWMGDLVPRRILNRYWGDRQTYMTLVLTLTALSVSVFTFYVKTISPVAAFTVLATVGCLAGVLDIVLFKWVSEPANTIVRGRHPLAILMEPLLHPEYRTLVVFGCVFTFSTMTAAGFMQIYVLKELQIEVWKTSVIWSTVGLGGSLVGRMWGRIMDQHGNRPVMLLCVALKPLVALAFLLVTARSAFVVLSIVFFFDSMLNCGYGLSVNGYMLKMAPRANRSMFIASIVGLSGIAGGLGSIAGGFLLRHTTGLHLSFAGRTWTHYHLLFLVSLVLRVIAIRFAAAVREPASAHPVDVLNFLSGQWPARVWQYPVGLYRRWIATAQEH